MFKTIKNAWGIPELRSKLIFTLFIIVLYRIGAALPVPFVDFTALKTAFTDIVGEDSIFQYFNILSGNTFSQATLFALSISPYITAQIVMQLLCVAIPALERLSKRGEEGRKVIDKISRYMTVGLALITAYGYYSLLHSYGFIADGFFRAVVVIFSYCAGASLIMWLAEKINDQGIGNGISIILFANIISALPAMVTSFVATLRQQLPYYWQMVLVGIVGIAILVATVIFCVFFSDAERKIPVQYAKRVVGRKMYGGQATTLPIKVNMSGVMPIIFASTLVSLPATILAFVDPEEGSFWAGVKNALSSGSWVYSVVMFVLIIAFAYFYVSISFNPVEVSNNLMKNGGFIPGIRPGKPTAAYITKILNRITLIGALFLGVVCIFPLVLNMCTGGIFQAISFGGSSMLIIVGVALETVREIEAQMTMRHYKGFLD